LSIRVLKQAGCPKWVIKHSQEVAKRALQISENFDVDSDLVLNGALLHDIGRCKVNGIEHAVIGAKMLFEMGFSDSLVKIVERHIGAGIPLNEAVQMGLPPKDYLPTTLEEKIVAHADNLLDGSRAVEIDFVIKKWESSMGPNHPAINRLKDLHRELIF
jgi:uncharacterized protein